MGLMVGIILNTQIAWARPPLIDKRRKMKEIEV
jgi:hypothetical protein